MDSGPSLEMVPIDGDHWLIRDHGHPSSDARHVIACVYQSDDGYDVVWVDASVPLPVRYLSREHILEDLARWRSRRESSARPVDIPSYPPFPAVRRRRLAPRRSGRSAPAAESEAS